MKDYNKLLFAGPVGAGKSTAIAAISDQAPVSTEAALSDGPMHGKTTTTVAMDYSYLNLDGQILHLYGLPGQERLGFMREILVPGALGALLLLNATSAHIYDEARHWLTTLADLNPALRVVVGITQSDRPNHFSLNRLRQITAAQSVSAPLLSVDARQREDIRQLIRLLLLQP